MASITFIISGGTPEYTVSIDGYVGLPVEWIFNEPGEYTINFDYFDECYTLLIQDSTGCIASAYDCCPTVDFDAEFVSPSCEQTWQCDLEYNILEISFLTTTTTTTCLRPSPLPNYYIMREINYSDSTVVNIQNMTVQDACDVLTLKCNDPLSNANGYTGGAGEIAQYPPELGDIVYQQWDKTNCFTFDDGTYILTTDLFGWRCENDKYIGHIEDGIITDLILCSVPTTTTTTTVEPTTTTTTTCDPLLCDYGLLYNWYAVNTGKLAPTGWHVPTDAEWTTLTDYLINNGYGFGGSGTDIAKSMASQCNWNSSSILGTPSNDPGTNNSSGFSGLPSGYRDDDGVFGGIGNLGSWWSSTEASSTNAWFLYIFYSTTVVYRINGPKDRGSSVRCLRDSYEGWENDVPVVDYDGNEYDVVEIGTQLWLVQNLKVTHYNDGESIPNITDISTWKALTTGALCAYNNDWDTYACVPEPTTTTTTTVEPTTTTTTTVAPTTTTTTTTGEVVLDMLSGYTGFGDTYDNGDPDILGQAFCASGTLSEFSVYAYKNTADLNLRAKVYSSVPTHLGTTYPPDGYLGQSTNVIAVSTLSTDSENPSLITFNFSGITVDGDFFIAIMYEDVIYHYDGTLLFAYGVDYYLPHMIYIGDLSFWIEYAYGELACRIKLYGEFCTTTTTTLEPTTTTTTTTTP